MLKTNEPYKSIFKLMKLLGLLQHEIKPYHKLLAALAFVIFGLGFWIPIMMSMLQTDDNEDFMDKFCLTASCICAFLEAINLFSKINASMEFLARIERILKKNHWEKAFSAAKVKSLRLVIFHSVISTIAFFALAGCSIYKEEFMADIYQFDFMEQDRFYAITWAYFACGSFYTHILSLASKLLPLIVMIFIQELLQALIDEFNQIYIAAIGIKVQICEWIDLHQEIIE